AEREPAVIGNHPGPFRPSWFAACGHDYISDCGEAGPLALVKTIGLGGTFEFLACRALRSPPAIGDPSPRQRVDVGENRIAMAFVDVGRRGPDERRSDAIGRSMDCQ